MLWISFARAPSTDKHRLFYPSPLGYQTGSKRSASIVLCLPPKRLKGHISSRSSNSTSLSPPSTSELSSSLQTQILLGVMLLALENTGIRIKNWHCVHPWRDRLILHRSYTYLTGAEDCILLSPSLLLSHYYSRYSWRRSKTWFIRTLLELDQDYAPRTSCNIKTGCSIHKYTPCAITQHESNPIPSSLLCLTLLDMLILYFLGFVYACIVKLFCIPSYAHPRGGTRMQWFWLQICTGVFWPQGHRTTCRVRANSQSQSCISDVYIHQLHKNVIRQTEVVFYHNLVGPGLLGHSSDNILVISTDSP